MKIEDCGFEFNKIIEEIAVSEPTLGEVTCKLGPGREKKAGKAENNMAMNS